MYLILIAHGFLGATGVAQQATLPVPLQQHSGPAFPGTSGSCWRQQEGAMACCWKRHLELSDRWRQARDRRERLEQESTQRQPKLSLAWGLRGTHCRNRLVSLRGDTSTTQSSEKLEQHRSVWGRSSCRHRCRRSSLTSECSKELRLQRSCGVHCYSRTTSLMLSRKRRMKVVHVHACRRWCWRRLRCAQHRNKSLAGLFNNLELVNQLVGSLDERVACRCSCSRSRCRVKPAQTCWLAFEDARKESLTNLLNKVELFEEVLGSLRSRFL
jgi:hypothetical protein